MFKSTIIVTIIGFLAKILAFFRDIFIANSFGATWETDVYNISITVTNIIYSCIGIALTSSLIPLMGKVENKYGDKTISKLCSNIINIFMIIGSILVVIIFIFSDNITMVMAPKYVGYTKTLTSIFIRISSLSLLAMIINSVINAFLQYKMDFFGASISNLVINLSIIVMMIFVPNMSIETLVIITVLSNFIQVLVQIPWLVKHKFKYEFVISFDNNIKYIFIATIPLLMGTLASQLNNIIDKSIASTLSQGSISALSYAYKIISLPHAIFGYAIVTVSFPYISKLCVGDKGDLFKFIQKISIWIIMIMGFCTFYLIFVRREVIEILFARGNFDVIAVNKTTIALLGYCIGLPFLAIKDIYIRVFYTVKENRFIMKTTILSVAINIVLNLLLVRYLGILALSMSTSIATILVTFFSYNKIKKIVKANAYDKKSKEMIKLVLAAILSNILIINGYRLLSSTDKIYNIIILFIISIIGLLLYICIIYYFNINGIKNNFMNFRNKIILLKSRGVLTKERLSYIKKHKEDMD